MEKTKDPGVAEQTKGSNIFVPVRKKSKKENHLDLVKKAVKSFKYVCRAVAEVDTITREISAISAYFHGSAACTTDLEEVSKELSFHVRCLPKYFEVRWAEFTASLFDSILYSWRELISYLEKSNEEQAKGFGRRLTKIDNLMLMCFLGMFCL